MNIHARRRQVTHALADLSEVVADVLDEAVQAGESGLTAAQVKGRSGMPSESEATYNILRHVLHLMAEGKVAVNNQPGQGHGSWRLL